MSWPFDLVVRLAHRQGSAVDTDGYPDVSNPNDHGEAP
jgi:hypothetical protein